jgi:hypothetical protein
MKKSQLRQLIREEIKKSYTKESVNEGKLLTEYSDQEILDLLIKSKASATKNSLPGLSNNLQKHINALEKKIKLSKKESVKEAEFKHISPSENKIKLAIKDVEKKFRLKANRDNPPQYAQLSLNKIMLSKVLGREELGKEHQGAWEKLKKEYNLREPANEGTCGYDTNATTGKKFKTPGGL